MKMKFERFWIEEVLWERGQKNVGEIVASKQDVKNAILRTSKGVYSKWFSKDDLERLFRRAKISKYVIMNEKSLQPWGL